MYWCKILCWKHIFPGLENQVKNGWECTRALLDCVGAACCLRVGIFLLGGAHDQWFELTEAKPKTKLEQSYFFFVFYCGLRVQINFLSWALYTSAGFVLLRMTSQSPIVTSSLKHFHSMSFFSFPENALRCFKCYHGSEPVPRRRCGWGHSFFFSHGQKFSHMAIRWITPLAFRAKEQVLDCLSCLYWCIFL